MKSQEMRVVGSKDQLAPLKALYGHCVYAAVCMLLFTVLRRRGGLLCMQESFEELTVCVFINHTLDILLLLLFRVAL